MSKMKHVRMNGRPTREAGDDAVVAVERVPTVTERATRTADRVDADAVAAALAEADRESRVAISVRLNPTRSHSGPTASYSPISIAAPAASS